MRQNPRETITNSYTYFIMKNGKVKWYNEIKGFGFIETENGDDIFVHRTGLHSSHSSLLPLQDVVFEIEKGDKGLFATNVKPASQSI